MSAEVDSEKYKQEVTSADVVTTKDDSSEPGPGWLAFQEVCRTLGAKKGAPLNGAAHG